MRWPPPEPTEDELRARIADRITRRARQDILHAMRDAGDKYVIETTYIDGEGNRTRRVISPIRFQSSKRFLAMCLCRLQPQWFMFARCTGVELKLAADYVMPVPIIELAATKRVH